MNNGVYRKGQLVRHRPTGCVAIAKSDCYKECYIRVCIPTLNSKKDINDIWSRDECEPVEGIESVTAYKGMILVCRLHAAMNRCGYVGVNRPHPLFGIHYNDNSNGSAPEDRFEVHGCLTYSDGANDGTYPINHDENIWWFGFDCAHYGDTLEKCTQEYVEHECKKLADQLAKLVEPVEQETQSDSERIANLEKRVEMLEIQDLGRYRYAFDKLIEARNYLCETFKMDAYQQCDIKHNIKLAISAIDRATVGE